MSLNEHIHTCIRKFAVHSLVYEAKVHSMVQYQIMYVAQNEELRSEGHCVNGVFKWLQHISESAFI